MSINLNESAEQSTGGGAPIPPGSKVFVKLVIQHPKTGRAGATYPLTRSANSSLEYLSTQLEVCTGAFAGKKIYHNFNLTGAVTDGQKKAVDISMRSMRALVEAAKGFSPKDASPQATQARQLNAWTDVEGLTFPIVVDCEISDPNTQGKRFVNNVMKKVVTADEPEYQHLRSVGEIITENPIPEIPAGNAAAQGKAAPPVPAWAQPQTTSAPAAAAPVPAWAQQSASAAQAPPPPPFPAQAGQIDNLPF